MPSLTGPFSLALVSDVMVATVTDRINLQLIMNRLDADPGWKDLLQREWTSLSALLEAAQDYVPGVKAKRRFVGLVNSLWGDRL